MKNNLTKILIIYTLFAVGHNVNAQVFYQQRFDTPGLPTGWTTSDESGNMVLWERCTDVQTDCHADLGFPLFEGTDKANGFMIIDSDGAGVLPLYGHQSRLTSSAIDCSDKDVVYAVFEQQISIRDFADDSGVPTFYVSYDSVSWVPYPIPEVIDNQYIIANFSETPLVASIDISQYAANRPKIFLRWEWQGNNEYWWILDNVRLTENLPNNLFLSNFHFPSRNYATPESQVSIDTFRFKAFVTNKGTAAQTNVKVYAYVREWLDQGQTINVFFADSVLLPILAPGVIDSAIGFTRTFIPTDLPTGKYQVWYEVVSDSADVYLPDNHDGDFFEVSGLLFSKEPRPLTAFGLANSGDWAVGNYYRMTPATLEQFKAVKIAFAMQVSGTLAPGTTSEVKLYRINDDVLPDFSNFASDGSSMQLIGSAPYELRDTLGFAQFTQLDSVSIFDAATGAAGVPLEANGRYLLSMWYYNVVNGQIAHSYGTNKSIEGVSSLKYTNGQWDITGIDVFSRFNVALRMHLDLAVTTDDTPLPDAVLQILPNPATDFVRLNIQFDRPTDATITIADIGGRVVRTENRAAMLEETITYPLSQLASGTYLARISTKSGTRTLKFLVRK